MKITVKNANPNKLHDDLIASGIKPLIVSHDKKEGEIVAQNTWVELASDTDMTAAQAIIDAHDPTPSPQEPSTQERIEALEAALLEVVLGG